MKHYPIERILIGISKVSRIKKFAALSARRPEVFYGSELGPY
jgi:hypothetical protein